MTGGEADGGIGHSGPVKARPSALLALGAVGAVLVGCTSTTSGQVPVPTISAGPQALSGTPAPPSPSAAPSTERALPVYYIADTPAGPRLYREFHRVATTDPATDAVREMLADATGEDPDYRNPWPPASAPGVPVTAVDGVITVDLTGVDSGPVDGAIAPLMLQQLVFTVQGALQSTDPVRILVDGEPADRLWGVPTAEPVARGDAMALRSLVQIDTPADGTEVGRDVTVSGEAAVFEGTVTWQVLREGRVVKSGFTTTAEGQTFSAYTFDVRLESGEYTVRVSEDDPSDGEGRPQLTDDKTITVG